MLKYTVKRLAQSLVTILLIATIVFLLMRCLPTDYYFTEEQLMKFTEEQKYAALEAAGLTDPIGTQLMHFYNDLLHLDFGTSRRIQNGASVVKVIGKKFGVSMRLGLISAGISLLVGGIGIMNIMLVSVTERTREIGIRKALGAKERTILSQFVVEAATTSALGGALGIALGYIVSMGANKVLPMFTSGTTVTVSPSFNSIAVAFGISVGIGVLFGYLPAKRAARLNPIEALRYD